MESPDPFLIGNSLFFSHLALLKESTVNACLIKTIVVKIARKTCFLFAKLFGEGIVKE